MDRPSEIKLSSKAARVNGSRTASPTNANRLAPPDDPTHALAPCTAARIALVTDGSDGQRQSLLAYLERNDSPPADWLLLKDAEELDAALANGRYSRVVFANLDALLRSVWAGQTMADRLCGVGARVDLAVQPLIGGESWRDLMTQVCRSHAQWTLERNRRRTTALIIASITALIALSLLFLLVSHG